MGDEEFQIGRGNNTNMTDLFQDSHKQPQEDDSNLQYMMMGLGLSSQTMDCYQPFRSCIEKSDESCSFRSMLEEDHGLMSSNTTSFQQAKQHWLHRSQKMMMYSSSAAAEDSEGVFSTHDLNPNTIELTSSGFQIDSSSTTSILPGLLGYEINQQTQQQQQQSMTFDNRSSMSNFNSYPTSYGLNSSSSSDHDHQQPNSWPSNNKPEKQLHLSNNASAPIINHDVRSNVFPSLQMQSPSSSFDEKRKKSSSSETSNKKPRNETSPLPAKARKEKMGDRITALQQLVSPFGKTDTASVLSEAIEYIKFLHEQLNVLSTAYIKSGVPIQQQKKCEKSKDPEAQKQDLRSRGLCLVPVSSTFPITHETSVDFWNPTFGGTFR